MHIDTDKLETLFIEHFPVPTVILVVCGLCWYHLRKSWQAHLADKNREIERLEELLKDATTKRDEALASLHKYLKKSG